jgi:hypothetical protein
MTITKRCQLDGKTYTMDIPKLTVERLVEGTALRNEGALIQEAFPYLTPDEREFLMTGTPPEVWEKLFGPGE